MIDYDAIPESLRGGMRRYIEEHIEAGGFLMAVLCNDLTDACGRADVSNQLLLFDIVNWLYNEAPGTCWGSPEKVTAWLAGRG